MYFFPFNSRVYHEKELVEIWEEGKAVLISSTAASPLLWVSSSYLSFIDQEAWL